MILYLGNRSIIVTQDINPYEVYYSADILLFKTLENDLIGITINNN